jgi:hypothetical protein
MLTRQQTARGCFGGHRPHRRQHLTGHRRSWAQRLRGTDPGLGLPGDSRSTSCNNSDVDDGPTTPATPRRANAATHT